MYTGEIKTITDKGFGFIKCSVLNDDVFCEKYLIDENNLGKGDLVTFEYENSQRGLRVKTIKKKKHFIIENALNLKDMDTDAYNQFCNECLNYVKKNEKVTTSKLRNIFTEIKKAKEVNDIIRLRPKIAYLSGRDKEARYFLNDIEYVISNISTDVHIKSFKEFFEAIICYKKSIERNG